MNFYQGIFKNLPVISLIACMFMLGCNNREKTLEPEVDLTLDVLIINGQVFIGDNKPSKALNIGIKNDRIVYIDDDTSTVPNAELIIDAEGKMITPGFIDPHTHSLGDLKSTDKNSNINYLQQGVTTVFNGNDGGGTPYLSELFSKLLANGVGTNVAFFAGHGAIRQKVMGRENRAPTPKEMIKMKVLVDQAMSEGAFGLSTALFYVPGTYAKTEEVIELAKVAAQHKGVYESHLRDESSYTIGLKGAVAEILEIGDKAAIPVHIAHIKALGVDVWGQSKDIIAMVENAQQKGQIVTADQYPWRASGTKLQSTTMPRWALAGNEVDIQARLTNPELLPRIKAAITENIRRRGGADSLVMVTTPHAGLKGKSIQDLSLEWQLNEVDTTIKILSMGVNENTTRVASYNMHPDDIASFMTQPWVMTSSDGTNGHPRKFASYPEKYQKFVIDKQLMPVESFIYKSSGQVADTFNIKERGYLREGYYADISIIDPTSFVPNANFSQWNKLTTGVEFQWINGKMTIDKGQYTGALAGRDVRH